MGDASTLGSIYVGWQRYQSLLVDALEPLTTEQLELRAAPALWPVWLLTAHVISARVYWFHQVLGEGDPSIAPLLTWDDPGQPVRSAAELVVGLNQTWRLLQTAIDRWTAADLAVTATTGNGRVVTRGWVVWHVVEHDLHHGGEISLTLGLHGVPALDL